MTDWFNTLERREQIFLTGGAIAAVLIIFWSFIWEPITTGRANLRDDVAQKQQLLTNLYRAAALSDDPDGATPAGQTLFVLIDESAKANGLGNTITRARPTGSNEINVSFSDAPFDSLLTWLVALNQSNGLVVDGASINSARQQGLVSGQVLLRR